MNEHSTEDSTPRRTGYFVDVDTDGLWDGGRESGYDEPYPTDDTIRSIEHELGHRLPDAYVELMRIRNGSGLRRSAFPMVEPTGWAEDHIEVRGIYSIGRTASWSLCGGLGSQFRQEQWGYPAIGVYFADTPSGGHEQLAFDYRACGPVGEPRVVYVDQENDYRILAVAPDFAAFIRGLVDPGPYHATIDDQLRAEALQSGLDAASHGTLSPFVAEALAGSSISESALRGLALAIVEEKGFFGVHDDLRSQLLLDVMFHLFTRTERVAEFDQFRAGSTPGAISLNTMLFTASDASVVSFRIADHLPRFVEDWWAARIADGSIEWSGGWHFTVAADRRIVDAMGRYG